MIEPPLVSPATLPDAIDREAIERVRAALAMLRSQVAGRQFARRPSPKSASRAYREALRDATSR